MNQIKGKVQLQLIFDGQGYKKQWQGSQQSSNLLISQLHSDSQEKNFIQQYVNANQMRKKRCYSLLDYKTILARQIQNITPSFEVQGQHVCSPCERTKRTNIEFMPKPENTAIIHTHKVLNKTHSTSVFRQKDMNVKPKYLLSETEYIQQNQQNQKQIFIDNANNKSKSFSQFSRQQQVKNNLKQQQQQPKFIVQNNIKQRTQKSSFKPLLMMSSPTLHTINENYVPWLNEKIDYNQQSNQNNLKEIDKWDSQRYIQNLKEQSKSNRIHDLPLVQHVQIRYDKQIDFQKKQQTMGHQQQYNLSNVQDKKNLQLQISNTANIKILDYIGNDNEILNSKQQLQQIYSQTVSGISKTQKNQKTRKKIIKQDTQSINNSLTSLDPWNVNKSNNSICNEQTMLK